MTFTTYLFTALAGILAIAAIGIYFFGIPPEMKRAMEKKALETMGENKASYMLKGETFQRFLLGTKSNQANRSNFQGPRSRPTERQRPQAGFGQCSRRCVE